MKAESIHIVCVALVVLATVGCQSGPRWAQVPQRLAWWKKDAASTDSSLVARSASEADVKPADPAPPVLPSTLATPQPLTAAATPPSANSVASVAPAATSPVAAPPLTSYPASIPTTSAATIAAAPTATYPTTAATQPYASSIATTTIPPAAPAAALAQAGPYDPNAYQAVASPAVPASSTSEIASAESDRYAMTATAPAADYPAADDRYAFNPSTGPSNVASNVTPSYAPPASDDRYGITPTPPAATSAMPAANPATPATTPYTPPAITPASPQSKATASSAATVAASTVRIDAPAGQYRPAGTSTYSGMPATSIEVASRPTTVAPAPATTPLPSNVPIYPTGNTSGRTY